MVRTGIELDTKRVPSIYVNTIVQTNLWWSNTQVVRSSWRKGMNAAQQTHYLTTLREKDEAVSTFFLARSSVDSTANGHGQSRQGSCVVLQEMLRKSVCWDLRVAEYDLLYTTSKLIVPRSALTKAHPMTTRSMSSFS